MGELWGQVKEDFRSFPSELLIRIRQSVKANSEEAAAEAVASSLQKTAMALKEAGISDEKAIALLQKYFDLRRSEAQSLVASAKNQFKKK